MPGKLLALAGSRNRIRHPMNETHTALNTSLGALLVVLNLGLIALVGLLVHHVSAQRRERRAQIGQLAEQLGRALVGLQKINSSVIAQTTETKDRLGALKPALEHAESLVREGANFTTDFKAVRGELRKLDERVESVGRAAAELAAGQATVAEAQAAVTGELRGLDGKLDALRQAVAAAAEKPAPPGAPPAPPVELRQLQEQVGSLQQVVAASAQAQAAGVGELRGELRTLSAGQQRSAQELRTRLDLELRQQEARFRDLAEKFLAESAQLRARLEAEKRAPLEPPRRQVVPAAEEAPKPELDAETRKEFRKIADRLDGLQRRMEEIIRL